MAILSIVSDDSVDSFFARMDKAMYVSKNNKRAEKNNQSESSLL
jgi:hypothetical protein